MYFKLADWADDEKYKIPDETELGDRRVTALSSSDVQLLHNWIRPD